MAITCTNPSRPASCVATVDLPTPVTPPSSTTQRPLQVAHVPPLAKAGQHLFGLRARHDLLGERPQLFDLHLAGAGWSTSRSSICSASANERSGASPVAISDWAISPFE